MKDVDGNYARVFQMPAWFDSLMAFASVCIVKKPSGDTLVPGCLIQADGTVTPRNSALTYWDTFAHDTEGTGIALLRSSHGIAALRNCDPVTLVSTEATVPDPIPLSSMAYFTKDRALRGAVSGRVYGETGAGTPEVVISDLGSSLVSFSPGPAPGQVFVCSNQAAALYDHINREVVSWKRVLGIVGIRPMMYSPKLGVWFVLEELHTPVTHNTVSIYADEPVPTTLAAPTALGTVGGGSAVEYRTRLLGAGGEPCAGVLVDWSATAPGVLLADQSTTDADGYAKTRVALPLGSEGGNFDLTAEVTL